MSGNRELQIHMDDFGVYQDLGAPRLFSSWSTRNAMEESVLRPLPSASRNIVNLPSSPMRKPPHCAGTPPPTLVFCPGHNRRRTRCVAVTSNEGRQNKREP